jgi:hypothetical protein
VSSDPTPRTYVRRMALDSNGHQILISDDNETGVLIMDGRVAHVIDAHHACAACDAYPVYELADADTVRIAAPCPHPDGVTTTFDLKVPSGRIVYANDLRPVYGDGHCEASYNTALGHHQYALSMAAKGCAYGHVGNSCPGLYPTGPGSYMIASPEYNEADGTEDPPESQRLALMVTGVWVYSIADYQDWRDKGGRDEDVLGNGGIIDIPAGTYTFTHLTGRRGFSHYADGPIVYARFEKTG